MQWIKRNLVLVLGGVIALALLGFAGFYLFLKIQQNKAKTEELDAATEKLKALAERNPYPNQENINAAQQEAKRLQVVLADLEKHFAPAPYPSELNNTSFRRYLDNTRAALLASAQKAGVDVPTNSGPYWFSFSAQKGTLNFPPAVLQPLAMQVADIKTLCGVLFDAKVNSLLWIKRVQVDTQQAQDASVVALGGTQDYLSNAKAVTNNWSVVMPYEVAFQGFSSQLAAVLEGLTRLPQCYVVTNIVVQPAATAGTPEDGTPGGSDYYTRYGIQQPTMSAGEMMRRRYGIGRYGPSPAAVMPVARPVSRNFLEEKPLRFTLSIQAVMLKPRGAAPAAGAAHAAGPAAAPAPEPATQPTP